MSFMINAFYDYDKSEFTSDTYDTNGNFLQTTTYNYDDYTSLKYFEIASWDEVTSPDWTELYKLDDDEKIESVSQEVYGSPNYWDVILGINAKNPLFDMVYNYDAIEASVEIYLENYEKDYFGIISEAHRVKLKTLFLQEKIALTEENRIIRVIRPEKLQDFFRLMKDRNFYLQDT